MFNTIIGKRVNTNGIKDNEYSRFSGRTNMKIDVFVLSRVHDHALKFEFGRA